MVPADLYLILLQDNKIKFMKSLRIYLYSGLLALIVCIGMRATPLVYAAPAEGGLPPSISAPDPAGPADSSTGPAIPTSIAAPPVKDSSSTSSTPSSPVVSPSTSTDTSTASATCGTDSSICNPVGGGKTQDVVGLLVVLIKYMLGLIGIVAVLMIIVGGYQLVMSAGNTEAQTKGKQTIIYAVAGVLLAVLSYSIVSIIENAIRIQK